MRDAVLYDLEILRADLARYDATMRLYYPTMHSWRMNRDHALQDAGHAIANGEGAKARGLLEQSMRVLERGSIPGFSAPRTFAGRVGELIARVRELDDWDSHPLDLDA